MNESKDFGGAKATTTGDYNYNNLIKRFPSVPEPAFETAEHLETYWGRVWGCDNDVGKLRAVLMHRPGPEMDVVDANKRLADIDAYGDAEEGWYWSGRTVPNMDDYRQQHAQLVAALEEEGVEVHYMEPSAGNRMKQVYTRDSVIMLPGGAIVTRLGPKVRRGEELAATRTLARLGIPILRTIHGTGILEGGSFAFINPKTAVVCLSSRTNEEGARQLEEVLNIHGIELIRVPISGYRLHIDGAFVMIDRDVALVNPGKLPFVFLERLEALGIRTVELTPQDTAWSINCLAVAPGRIFVSHQFSAPTLEILEKLGISVRVVPYDTVCLGGGGIHCSTSPLIRDAI